jgi:monoamine oxidase
MSSTHSSKSVDVIVVGGGLAGLSAARAIRDAGRSTVVLEARDRVGGRTLNRQIGNGIFDMGGQFVSPDQENVKRLVKEFGLELVPMYQDGRKIQDIAGDISQYSLPVPMPSFWKPFPFANLIALGGFMAQLEIYRMGVPMDRPWLTPKALKWDSLSVEAWRQRQLVTTAAARGILDPILRTALGVEASETSMLNLLFFMQSAGGLLASNKALTYRFAYGSQEMSLKLAEKLGNMVVLEAPTRVIEQGEGGVTVTTDSGVWEGRYVIVTVPVPLAGQIRFDPPLPGIREGLMQRMPMASEVKIFATYERAFWRDAGLSGQVVTDSGPLSVIYDNTTPNGQAALLGLAGGRNAHGWGLRSAAERRRAVFEQLALYFGPRALDATDYSEQDWREEEWTRGCPLAIMSPAGWMFFGPALREPAGRIHWAGSELAPRWCTFMDGAISSGEETAHNVLELLAGGQPTSAPGSDLAQSVNHSSKEPVDMARLIKAFVVLFIAFGFVISLADRVWVALGMLVYPTVGPGKQPLWVAPQLGIAGVGVVLTYRFLSRWVLKKSEHAGEDHAVAVLIGAAWFLAAHLGGLFYGTAYPKGYLVALSTAWLLRVIFAKLPFRELLLVVGYSLGVAVGGAGAEAMMSKMGLMHYPDGPLFGVPLWLPGLWLHAALWARAMARAWFGGR